MSAELLFALDELEKEKGIDKEIIIAAIEEALNASYSKSETEINTRVEFNRETGEIKVFAQKEVVEVVENDSCELSLAEARTIDPEFELGEIAEFEIMNAIVISVITAVIIKAIKRGFSNFILSSTTFGEFQQPFSTRVVGGTLRKSYRPIVIIESPRCVYSIFPT